MGTASQEESRLGRYLDARVCDGCRGKKSAQNQVGGQVLAAAADGEGDTAGDGGGGDEEARRGRLVEENHARGGGE